MFCKNCGRELDDGVKFCDGCGSPVNYDNNVIAQESPVTSTESIVKANFPFKKIIIPVAGVIGVLVLLFIIGVMTSPSLTVEEVKKSQLNGYNTITIGKAFDHYFDNTSWEDFNSEEGLGVVEFKGECKYGLYDPYDATVTIQFVRDPDVDDDSFYIYSIWLSIMYKEDCMKYC
ncbi:MAG: zinc-ribbon domain-containing protein [Oscillospiraceae bacterium]|nr:zinc-ribbon domain-containing protein [Oscillospiraceae bacterium]